MNAQSVLNPRQKAFVEFFCQGGNALQAALQAGYSKNYAINASFRIKENPLVQKAIAMRMAELRSERIADTREILEYLTRVMRGESEDEQAMNIGKGNGVTAVEKVKLKVSSKDRVRAAELLAKVNGMFLNKQELDIKSAVQVVIHDDI